MKRTLYFSFLLLFTLSACSALSDLGGISGPPSNAVQIEVMANTSLTPWLTQAIDVFNQSEYLTASEQPVWVNLSAVDAGQAVVDLSKGASPALWIPDDPVWVGVLAQNNVSSFQEDCVSLATSPLVIAMWQPIAESLGWPGRELGWLDIGSLAADSTAWDFYSGGQFGEELRLGHTHPGLSGTGSATMLAIVQAAQSKTEAVSVSDISEPIVQASVGAFEGAVSWFSSNTAELGQAMRDRGPEFLGAAVMYESDVAAYGGGEIIPIYPFEGTFVASHPACVNKNSDVLAQEGALIFRNYLSDLEAQTSAALNGLRPTNAEAAALQTLNSDLGFQADQPETTIESPTVAAIYAIQDVWQAARKPVNLVMVLDTSGSMEGAKINNLRSAASQFVQQMTDDDFLTIIIYENFPVIALEHANLADSRNSANLIINSIVARGNTPLYDSIGWGADTISRSTSSQTSNVMVILSDGQDTSSSEYSFGDRLFQRATDNSTTIFTIAYGRDADENLLGELAFRANGNFYLGDEASIAAIYEEMSAAFGGSVGIGR